MQPTDSSTSTSGPFVEGMPLSCHRCGAALCLRKQVVNMALGNTDEMLCLICLGRDNNQQPAEVLTRLKRYILTRECFRKEWLRYINVDFCPDRSGCLPAICFSQEPDHG